MPDREKVIKGLTACIDDMCDYCPYYDEEVSDCDYYGRCNRIEMNRDALALLREQKPDEPRCNSGINGVTSKPAQLQRCVCGTLIVRRGDAHSCPYCGRAVKWDD